MEPVFTVDTIHNLEIHREFVKGTNNALPRSLIARLISLTCLIYLLCCFEMNIAVYAFFVVAACEAILILAARSKKGDIQFKRMLQSNGGEPIHFIAEFFEEELHVTDRNTCGKSVYRYDVFRKVIETQNLLILVMQHRSCIILEKRWVKGGSAEALAGHILFNSPNIKRKKLSKPTFGRILNVIITIVTIVGVIAGILQLGGLSVIDQITGKLGNSMSYQEMAQELEALDIYISTQTITEMEAYDTQYLSENGTDYYTVNFTSSKIYDLLYWEGAGIYDENTWEWTPSRSGIFWLDMEVWSVDTIYADFLIGLSAMNPEVLNFTNIQEDYSSADLENGTGTVTISFDWNGSHYDLSAEYDYDWFDMNVLYELGTIISLNSDGSLYYYFDGQGCLLYYGTAANVRALKRMTGLDFSYASNALYG